MNNLKAPTLKPGQLERLYASDPPVSENNTMPFKIGLLPPGQTNVVKNLIRFSGAIQLFDNETDADEWLRVRNNVIQNSENIVKVRVYICL